MGCDGVEGTGRRMKKTTMSRSTDGVSKNGSKLSVIRDSACNLELKNLHKGGRTSECEL